MSHKRRKYPAFLASPVCVRLQCPVIFDSSLMNSKIRSYNLRCYFPLIIMTSNSKLRNTITGRESEEEKKLNLRFIIFTGIFPCFLGKGPYIFILLWSRILCSRP